MTKHDITFEPAGETDFEAFHAMRTAAMKEQVLELGHPWDDDVAREYHTKVFAEGGIRKIFANKKLIGFIGVHDQGDHIKLASFCIDPSLQNKGLGTRVMELVLAEESCARIPIKLDVLTLSRVHSMYLRFGFVRTHDKDIFTYYERQPTQTAVA